MHCDCVVVCCRCADEAALNSGSRGTVRQSLSGLLPRPIGRMRGLSKDGHALLTAPGSYFCGQGNASRNTSISNDAATSCRKAGGCPCA